ncbi:hypothetical protein [Blastochloris viridis]|uniref:Lipocalin-like domain-containing protein n=1 Tax=Blastochloris viridis TaxID=1079 RepID=A0A0H5BBT6_BLAVI|nr:hypothetical protein [Blastochloris viridis]ALK08150.1 hypothetical protein BVIR_351 [Blastochloris viridis]BAR98584.1 hypothetical protein BV133_991 [Blastochloris viridis]CUU44072.1 hypothetical protein BVIRIDIS_31180 [Blastochloris viridis]
MDKIPADLVGSWIKLDAAPQAEEYPDVLRIEPSGIYRGGSAGERRFLIWDDGTVRKVRSDRLAISTATDAIVDYSFRLADDVLEITTPEALVLRYRRGP